jgi:hypothetical protein
MANPEDPEPTDEEIDALMDDTYDTAASDVTDVNAVAEYFSGSERQRFLDNLDMAEKLLIKFWEARRGPAKFSDQGGFRQNMSAVYLTAEEKSFLLRWRRG